MTFNEIVFSLLGCFLLGWFGGGYLGYQMGKLKVTYTSGKPQTTDPVLLAAQERLAKMMSKTAAEYFD